MKITNGINLDGHESELNGQLRFAKNVIRSKGKSYYENEKGFLAQNILPAGMLPIGFVETENLCIIFSSNGTASEIGVFNGFTYVPKVSEALFSGANALNFKPESPITGEAQRNIRGQLIVAFRDDRNPPRVINLDDIDIPFNIGSTDTFTKSLIPSIKVLDVLIGGSLKSGTYHVGIALVDSNGTETSILSISHPAYVVASQTSEGDIDSFHGSQAGILSGKLISLRLSNVDLTYAFVKPFVAQVINGVTTVYSLPDIPINNRSVFNIVVAGNENQTPSSTGEMLAIMPDYVRAGSVAQNNNNLFWGGVTTAEPLNLQPYANIVTIQYVIRDMSPNSYAESYKNPAIASNYKGFMWDEVYAFYICFTLKNGQRTQAFHIPGRAPVAAESLDSGYFPGARKYQVEDTSTAITPASGKMSYWENRDEQYPDSNLFATVPGDIRTVDLRNQRVRHHKFPSLRKQGNYDHFTIPILGIEVGNVIIPQQYEGLVDGYEIYYAKRDFDNATVLGSDIELHGYKFTNTNTFWGNRIVSTGGNFDTRNLFTANGNLNAGNLDVTIFRSHAPDLLLDKIGAGVDYITLSKGMVKTVDRDFPADIPIQAEEEPVYVLDFTRPARVQYQQQPNFIAANNPGQYRVAEKVFLDNGVISDNYNNLFLEDTLLLKTSGEFSALPVIPKVIIPHSGSISINNPVRTNLIFLNSLKRNVYNPMYGQSLAKTEYQYDTFANSGGFTGKVYFGGDIFVSKHTIQVYGHVHNDFGGTDKMKDLEKKGSKLFYVAWLYTVRNMNYRYENEGDLHTKFFPASKPSTNVSLEEWPSNMNRDRSPKYLYSNDFSRVNDYVKTTIKNPFIINVSVFPYRIVRSKTAAAEEQETSWRTYRANDYYEMRRDKGPIIQLVNFGEVLLIHTAYSLFATRSRTQLQTSDFIVNLGSGDIFELEPKEILSTRKGYAGMQHKFAGYVCKYGYVFVNEADKKIFRYSGGETAEEMTEGIEHFLMRNLAIPQDNPFNGNGIHVSFDEVNDLAFITFKGERPFTISFCIPEKRINSFHDYVADCMLTVRNQSYSFRTGNAYKHGFGPYGMFYNVLGMPQLYPGYVDFIVGGEQNMALQSFGIRTEHIRNGIRDYDTPITHVTVRTDVHCDNRTRMVNMENTRQVKGIWNFNSFRDRLKRDSQSDFQKFTQDVLGGFTVDPAMIDPDIANARRVVNNWFVIRLENDNMIDANIRFMEIMPVIIQSNR